MNALMDIYLTVMDLLAVVYKQIYTAAYTNILLIDIDECLVAAQNENRICPESQICMNNPGNFSCICTEGTILQDDTCISIQLCSLLNVTVILLVITTTSVYSHSSTTVHVYSHSSTTVHVDTYTDFSTIPPTSDLPHIPIASPPNVVVIAASVGGSVGGVIVIGIIVLLIAVIYCIW